MIQLQRKKRKKNSHNRNSQAINASKSKGTRNVKIRGLEERNN